MSHYIFGGEGYKDSIAKFERFFHHRPYKNGRYFSRVRTIQFFGIFRWWDFTIEEGGEKEFLADIRCFLNNDLGSDRRKLMGKKSLFKKILSLDFYPINIWKLEIDKTDDNAHFKKYAAWKAFDLVFNFLKLFGMTRPKIKQQSFIRQHWLEDGEAFLMQGFFIGKLNDRKIKGVEYL